MADAQIPVAAPSWHATPDAPPEQSADGFFELYARHEVAESWLVFGWVVRSRIDSAPLDARLEFERGIASGPAVAAFYERPDVGPLGRGMILALPSPPQNHGRLLGVTLCQPSGAVMLQPTDEAEECTGAAIVALAEPALTHADFLAGGSAEDGARLARLLAPRVLGRGYVDLYGTHVPSSGVFIVGWVSDDWIAEATGDVAVTALFEDAEAAGGAVMHLHDREDIRGTGLGVILHVAIASPRPGRLISVRLQSGAAVVIIRPADGVRVIPVAEATVYFQSVIARSEDRPARDALLRLVSRRAFEGRDTLAALAVPIGIDFDDVIVCAPDSIVLCGWMLAPEGSVSALRLRCDTQTVTIDRNRDWVTIPRPDVIEANGAARGFEDPRCGFVVRVALAFPLAGDLHLEIETATGEIAFKTIPAPRLDGLAAIRRLLGSLVMQYADVDTLFDHVLGPPVAALNARRLHPAPEIVCHDWGVSPAAPHASVIVPLYGRIDFIEYQMARFAAYGLGDDVEIIYVLDDPPRMREMQFLAASVHARFRIAFKLLCLGRNMGYAPANNIGLRAASGDTICFMNSDVFPMDGTWLRRLTMHLALDPSLGVVGPTLLYEDGTVQHQGMSFKRLPQFGGWWFSQHPRKGWRPVAGEGLARHPAITGACMVLRRRDALACGGFDEAYAIGDFEDSDLCFKLAERGLQAAVDPSVFLYHLERKSQAGSASPWRTNLTVFNAWIHQRRWAARIDRENPL